MRSMTATRASARARRASDSGPVQVLARAGLAARGVIYVLIGWVAILVALGKTRRRPISGAPCSCCRGNRTA